MVGLCQTNPRSSYYFVLNATILDNTVALFQRKNKKMKAPLHIAVTGAAGQISYSLLFRLAAGHSFGKDQPIVLHLLEVPAAMPALEGVVMELNDCASPIVSGIEMTDDPLVAFKNVDYAFLIGARPRTLGMVRKDLLEVNAEIFSTQGKALNAVANRNVKVLITGNPAGKQRWNGPIKMRGDYAQKLLRPSANGSASS